MTLDQELAALAIVVAIVIGVPGVFYARRAVVKSRSQKRREATTARKQLLTTLMAPVAKLRVAALAYEANPDAWIGYRDTSDEIKKLIGGIPANELPKLRAALDEQDPQKVRAAASAAEHEINEEMVAVDKLRPA
jgi:hypothetical protein